MDRLKKNDLTATFLVEQGGIPSVVKESRTDLNSLHLVAREARHTALLIVM